MKLSTICEGPKDVESLSKRFTGFSVYIDGDGSKSHVTIRNRTGTSLGDAWLYKAKSDYWTISNISAVGKEYKSNKWGPLLYDIIMEFATINGNGLIPAETFTLWFSDRINFKDQKFSKPGTQVGEDLLNLTSPDSQKIYNRLFNSKKGLYGQPINVEPLDMDKVIEKIGPMYSPQLAKGTEVGNLPWNWREKPELLEIIKKNGGIVTKAGWPLFLSHTKAMYGSKPYLFAIYTKSPFVIPKLKEKGLI